VTTTIKKYDMTGKEIGHVVVSDSLVEAEANGQMVKDYITALRANARQWSANTKGRSEVNHTTKKPHPQKGTGRARQGMLSAPQYKGGGRVHGPKPKFDQHVKINKKERKAAIRFLIGEKIRHNNLIVIENTDMQAPKTKEIAGFLKRHNLGKRVLFLGEGSYFDLEDEFGVMRFSMPSDKHENFIKSVRNLPKVEFALATNVSGYDVIVAHDIVLTETALQELNQWLA